LKEDKEGRKSKFKYGVTSRVSTVIAFHQLIHSLLQFMQLLVSFGSLSFSFAAGFLQFLSLPELIPYRSGFPTSHP
jgi:hypothetical protein